MLLESKIIQHCTYFLKIWHSPKIGIMGLINRVFIWTKQVPFIHIVIFPSLPKETLTISHHSAAPLPHTSVPSWSLVAGRTMTPKETHSRFKGFHFHMSLCCLSCVWKYSTAPGFFSWCETMADNTCALHSVHTHSFDWNKNVQSVCGTTHCSGKSQSEEIARGGIDVSVKFGRLRIPA